MNYEEPTIQRYLKNKGLIAFLAALGAVPSLSTDLYLPALPKMTVHFGAPAYQVNLTLTVFFVFYAVSLLVSGPLSDRFGRKPVVLVGLVVYAAAGLLCAASSDVVQLIVFRILQALGGGAASTVATAIVKDVYRGRKREVTLAVVQSMTILAPMLAPMIGAFILRFTSWRGAFVAQAICGILVLAAGTVFQETAHDRLTGNPLASLKRLGVVLKNRTFSQLLVNFSLFALVGLLFISSSSYIFEDTFGVSSQIYSFFFAFFGVGIALGPTGYILLSRRLGRNGIITACFVACVASGLLVLVVGVRGPWAYIITFFPTAVALGMVRPPSTFLMLEQHETDAGSVSGLITATNMIVGGFATVIATVEIWGRVQLVGMVMIASAVVGLGLWLGVSRPRMLAQERLAESPERA